MIAFHSIPTYGSLEYRAWVSQLTERELRQLIDVNQPDVVRAIRNVLSTVSGAYSLNRVRDHQLISLLLQQMQADNVSIAANPSKPWSSHGANQWLVSRDTLRRQEMVKQSRARARAIMDEQTATRTIGEAIETAALVPEPLYDLQVSLVYKHNDLISNKRVTMRLTALAEVRGPRALTHDSKGTAYTGFRFKEVPGGQYSIAFSGFDVDNRSLLP